MVETRLAQALRHVRQGEDEVRRQRELVETLRETGRDSGKAEELLETFERSLRLHRSNLERIVAELDG
jgi:hypothetical protein